MPTHKYGPFASDAGLYMSKDWHPVPVEPKSKRISVDGFTGHDGVYASAAQVRAWERDYNVNNIGLRLGHDVIGIDVDAYGERDGGSSLAALESELGPLPLTYVSTSREDGVSGIRMFRVLVSEPVNWRGKAAGGIDVISWHYRYVVCSPSIHPTTREQYFWYNQNDGGTECDVPEVSDLPMLPSIWQEFLSSDFTGVKSDKLDVDVIIDWLSLVGGGEECEVMTETLNSWSERIMTATDDGGIHDEAKDGIHALVGDAVAGHAGCMDALAGLEVVFRNARDVRGGERAREADAEWRRLIYGEVRLRRGTETLMDDPCTDEYASAESLKSMRPVNSRTGMPYDRDEKEIARRARELRLNRAAKWKVDSENVSEAPEPINCGDFMKMDIKAPRVLIDNLLPLDGNSILVAQRKAGKTTIVHNLIRAMCNDDDFLGTYPVHKPEGMKFALLDFEMHEGMLHDWLRSQNLSAAGEKMCEIFRFRGKSSSFNIMSNSAREAWAKALTGCGVEWIILDCLAPAMAANGLDENDNSSASAFLNAFDEVCKMANVCGSLVIHHMGHSSERGRGASRLRDWPDTEIHLIVDNDGQDDNGRLRPRAKRFLTGEGRLGAFDEVELSYEEESRHLFVSGGSRDEAAKEAALPAVMNFIQQHPGCSKKAALDGVAGRRTSKMQAMSDLIDDGSLCVHEGGRGSHNLYDEKVCPDSSVHPMKVKMK